MIAIDWSHTKGLMTYDGQQTKVETLKSLISRLSKSDPKVVIENGCPLSLIYNLTIHNIEVHLIGNELAGLYRKEQNIEKTDENDAKIIYNLANNGAKSSLANPDILTLKLADIYHNYCKYQKARLAIENMKQGHMRSYGVSGDNESVVHMKSGIRIQLSPHLVAYDEAISILKGEEKGLLRELEKTAKNVELHQKPKVRGLGRRLWLGIMVTCNPVTFKCLSSYLRFCGLNGDVVAKHKYNHHARMLYHMLAEEVLIKKDPNFRVIYDKCKADIIKTHSDYTKSHIHSAALNRTATFLAKHIYNYVKDSRQGGESAGCMKSTHTYQPPCLVS